MRIIDAHVHLDPPEVGRDPAAWAVAQGEPLWATLCTRRRRDGRPVQTFPTVAELLRDMDAAGIEKSVLLGWYWQQPATAAWQNRFYARCVREHPDRLAAFAAIHPAAGETGVTAELRRAREEGLCGLGELSPHAQGCAVDDPVLAAALALAGELALPVNIHATDPQAGRYPGRVETPADDFIRLARAHPAVAFVLAHWGGGLLFREASPAARPDLANVIYDTAASPLCYDDRIWRAALDVVPPSKVIFGSDYPLILYPKAETAPGWRNLLTEVGAAGLTAEESGPLLAGNAAGLLGIQL